MSSSDNGTYRPPVGQVVPASGGGVSDPSAQQTTTSAPANSGSTVTSFAPLYYGPSGAVQGPASTVMQALLQHAFPKEVT